jgi:hypothetical protein
VGVKREILCEYQPYLERPIVPTNQLRQQAVSNDGPTVDAWRPIWKKNIEANFRRFGSFREHGLGRLWGAHRNSPAIVIGSGPSLKDNVDGLKENRGIPTVSCLHNFHFLEDKGVGADYYVTLDAGPLVIDEVSEGGEKTADEYWAMTRGKKLLAYIGTDPRLFDKWQGEVFFFNCPVDPDINGFVETFEVFNTFVSTGGNVFGAAMYIAKAIFGCNPLIFMGANFSFSYLEKFHGWDSKYDADLGQVVRMADVYGNSVKSWQSYANFKAHFDWVSQVVPGLYINATEGGTFGAYPGGNIRNVLQMDLKDVLRMFNLCDETKASCESPETGPRHILF